MSQPDSSRDVSDDVAVFTRAGARVSSTPCLPYPVKKRDVEEPVRFPIPRTPVDNAVGLTSRDSSNDTGLGKLFSEYSRRELT